MSINKSYAVFGLGRFGMAAARELVKSGAEVLAVDSDSAIVDAASKKIPVCKCADVTDPEVINRLGIGSFDVVIIAMAERLEESILALTLCKDAGVGHVIVKCADEMKQRILLRAGADEAIIPEKEYGARLARNLVSAGFAEMVELSDDISMVEIDVKKDWAGKSLAELNLRKKYGINVVAIRKADKVDINADPAAALSEDMTLVVVADTAKLRKLK